VYIVSVAPTQVSESRNYFATDCMLKPLYFHISVEYENPSSFS